MKKSRSVPKPQKSKRAKYSLLFFFTVVIIMSIYGMYTVDKNFAPMMIKVSRSEAVTRFNALVLDTINTVTAEKGLKSEDFYIKVEDSDGKIRSLSVNTVLVNEICAKIASDISEGLSNMSSQKIPIPLGTVLGLTMFSNIGPAYKVTILPKGMATADYESQFGSAGINQINFQVWVTVKATVEIVNPVQELQIQTERKIVLVNSIITGEIPSTYFNYDGDKK